MTSFLQLRTSNPFLPIFTAVGLSCLVGSARVFGFSLGVSAVLLAAAATLWQVQAASRAPDRHCPACRPRRQPIEPGRSVT